MFSMAPFTTFIVFYLTQVLQVNCQSGQTRHGKNLTVSLDDHFLLLEVSSCEEVKIVFTGNYKYRWYELTMVPRTSRNDLLLLWKECADMHICRMIMKGDTAGNLCDNFIPLWISFIHGKVGMGKGCVHGQKILMETSHLLPTKIVQAQLTSIQPSRWRYGSAACQPDITTTTTTTTTTLPTAQSSTIQPTTSTETESTMLLKNRTTTRGDQSSGTRVAPLAHVVFLWTLFLMVVETV